MKIKYYLILLILAFTLSCGLPDASSIYVDMNQPYITRVSPGSHEMTIYFEAQNNEENFVGYNIYYGDNVYQKEYTIYNNNSLKPTIIADKSQTVKQYEYTIKVGANYSNTNGTTGSLQESDIPNGFPRYIVVTAYDLFNNRESSYAYDYFVALGVPRPEVNNQTLNVGNEFNGISGFNLGTLINDGGILKIEPSSSSALQIQAATSLNDVNYPPLSGYSSDSVAATPNTIYLMTTTISGEMYYAKIFIQSVDGTSSIVADYAVQTAAGLTNY